MFSRTTIASSISKPTHRLSAISVIMLMVKPKMSMKKNVPISAIGSVSPVMTVERHEFRNRNTISTVSTAPSISVRRTLSTATRMGRDASRIGSSRTPGGSSGWMAAMARTKPSTTSMVFSSCDFCTDSSRVRSPLRSARLSISCAPSFTLASWPSVTAVPFLRVTMMRLKSSGRCIRASICTTRSCCGERMVPSGSSWFSLRTALATWSAVMP